ncbi:hypothetical protein Aduo_017251 [Ancylostoma duodenale]
MQVLFCTCVLLFVCYEAHAAPKTDMEIKKLLAEGRTMEEMDEIRRLLRMLNEATVREVSKLSKTKQNFARRDGYIGRRKLYKKVGQNPLKRTGHKRQKNVIEINKELLPYLFQGDINLTREQLLEMLNIRHQNTTRSTSF